MENDLLSEYSIKLEYFRELPYPNNDIFQITNHLTGQIYFDPQSWW